MDLWGGASLIDPLIDFGAHEKTIYKKTNYEYK